MDFDDIGKAWDEPEKPKARGKQRKTKTANGETHAFADSFISGDGELLTIKIAAGELPRHVDETEAALLAADRGLYKREGQIVRIAEVQVIAADEKTTTALAIIEQSEHTLLEDACAAATYFRFNHKDEAWVRTDPPLNVIKALQGRMTRLRFPTLMGIISTPLILTAGRVIDKPGYDARTGLYFDPLGTSFPPIPEKPTQEEAREALNLLCDLLEEFPFTSEASKAVALSGLLTSVSRRALDFAFMHGITAPAFGSGKSYLADVFCMIASGRCAPVVSPGKSPEEFEKRLDGALLKGLGAMAIDNVNGMLEGERLSQILSQSACEVRLFGTQRNLIIVPTSLVTATGVNLLVVEDLRRRTLLCSLDAQEERPELRTFQNDPVAMITADRGKYVVAALTIIRAFMVAGRPHQAKPINGYQQYCSMVRDPLIWLGCVDPCSTMEEIRQHDSRLATKHQIAAQWRAVFGDKQYTTVEVIERASERHRYEDDRFIYPEFHAALSEVAGGKNGISALRLGQWLGRAKGSVMTLETDQGPARHAFKSEFEGHTKKPMWRLCRL